MYVRFLFCFVKCHSHISIELDKYKLGNFLYGSGKNLFRFDSLVLNFIQMDIL